MLSRFLLLALAGAALIGCGPRRDGGGGLTYVPPAAAPPATGAAFVPAPVGVVLDRLAERLPEAGLTVDRIDRDRGLVVARYGGDPEPYVDCGWIVAPGNGRRGMTAAQEQVSFARAFEGTPTPLERDLRLDSRLVVTVTPGAGGSLVDPAAAYVLTKSVGVLSRSGLVGEDREIISFNTGSSGEFRAGTVCQPSGSLERLALEDPSPTVVAAEPVVPSSPPTVGAAEPVASPQPALATEVRDVIAAFACPDVDVTFGPDDAVLVSGYVADPFSEAELPRQLRRIPGVGPVEARLAVHGPEFCQALEAVAPYRHDGGGLEIRAVTPDGTDTLSAGERLVLDITVPAPDVYLTIDRIAPDGRVTHLAAGRPAAELGAGPGATSFRLDTGRDARSPFGREMIVAFATEQPLFDRRRPAAEPAGEYLAELRRRVEELRAQGEPVGAAYTVVTTRRGPGV